MISNLKNELSQCEKEMQLHDNNLPVLRLDRKSVWRAGVVMLV